MKIYRKLGSGFFSTGAGMVLALSAFAAAQSGFAADSADASGDATKGNEVLEEVVVTGTSLRGVAPAGAESFALDSTQIQATQALSTDALLAQIPQLSSFGALPTQDAGGIQLTVNRTNLRNLPQGVGGGSPTLVLMDGHRLVGAGRWRRWTRGLHRWRPEARRKGKALF